MKFDIKKILIDKRQKLTKLRQRSEWSVTIFGWLVWLFFCRPILLLFLWVAGFKALYKHFVRLDGLDSLLIFFSYYVYIIIAIILIARGWNFYNKRKFGQTKDRRKHAPPVTSKELDQYFNLKAGSADKISDWKEVQVDFVSAGHIKVSDGRKAEKDKGKFEGHYQTSIT